MHTHYFGLTSFLNSPQFTLSEAVPVSKVPVGLAKGPDLKNVKSKIGSLNNVKHKPGSFSAPNYMYTSTPAHTVQRLIQLTSFPHTLFIIIITQL